MVVAVLLASYVASLPVKLNPRAQVVSIYLVSELDHRSSNSSLYLVGLVAASQLDNPCDGIECEFGQMDGWTAMMMMMMTMIEQDVKVAATIEAAINDRPLKMCRLLLPSIIGDSLSMYVCM